MKLLVIGLTGAGPDLLFGDERLVNVRRLMEGGCYGRVQGAGTHFTVVQSLVTAAEWVCLQYVALSVPQVLGPPTATSQETGDAAVPADFDYTPLDEMVGRLLEPLDDQSAVVVVAHGREDTTGSAAGAFVLAAPNSPLQGELSGVDLLDIAPTLLELGGFPIPAAMPGKSLVAGKALAVAAATAAEDDEEALRARLRGLGYIE